MQGIVGRAWASQEPSIAPISEGHGVYWCKCTHTCRQSKTKHEWLDSQMIIIPRDHSETDTTQNVIFDQQKKVLTESEGDEATATLHSIPSLSRMKLYCYKPCSQPCTVQYQTAVTRKLFYSCSTVSPFLASSGRVSTGSRPIQESSPQQPLWALDNFFLALSYAWVVLAGSPLNL